ncbi:MAG: hypothetical protein IT572_06025 [Deltaproteobacteria bacterium]|nr:hypothetical protein [Deltaproteobacteria bacterium]
MKKRPKKRKLGAAKADLKKQWQAHWKEISKKFDEAKREGSRIFSLSKRQYENSLRDLDRQRKKLQGDLHRLAGRSDLAWTDVKKGFKAAAKDVDRAVKRAVADFKRLS